MFHPAVRYDGDDDIEVSWAEVAAYNGTTAHRLMQWHTVTGSWDAQPSEHQAVFWDDGPARGAPARGGGRAPGRRPRPAHRDAGGLRVRPVGRLRLRPAGSRAPPRLLLRGGHDVVLVRGAVTDAVRNLAPEPHEQSANVWWPADHAWCVVTDIDLTSTYVGGSAECIAELLGTPGVEAMPAAPTDSTALAADMLNPHPRAR